MADVIYLSTIGNDNRYTTPEDLLKECLEVITSPNADLKPNRCLIVLLDDTEDQYSTQVFSAKLRPSDAIALLEVTKHRMMEKLDYGE